MAKAPKKTEAEADDRPLFRVNEKSFVGHAIAEEGATVVYEPEEDGEIGENLTPLNEAAQALVDAQKGEHPDKTGGKKARSAKAQADAAAASVGATDEDLG